MPPGSHDLAHERGSWRYLYSYFGGTDFAGQETVWHDGEPIDRGDGETDHFSGHETIFVDGEVAYELDCRGGLIVP
ncbi:hypothetical protein SJ05684_c09500 [Sinorhizobium sojae CCBAU 05684]|uniref:Uncharacterized protein n=1 Tax=Sinorhizobium sojae CCBAU 05684 TaxID=716928 RepID=A0A249PAU2_9HYPH|nr:hypothetical protein SJ05684_c09500 [Sinorhizobium sojae CCBAU 05684]